MRNFKYLRNFEFRWNLKRREILKCRGILNIVKFKCYRISNASKISNSLERLKAAQYHKYLHSAETAGKF
nr:hypothetical protein [uncultured Campylobacter sp.]